MSILSYYQLITCYKCFCVTDGDTNIPPVTTPHSCTGDYKPYWYGCYKVRNTDTNALLYLVLVSCTRIFILYLIIFYIMQCNGNHACISCLMVLFGESMQTIYYLLIAGLSLCVCVCFIQILARLPYCIDDC